MTQPLPESMDVVEIAEPGGPENLRATTAAVPRPAAGEVLIRVAAAGVNRPDVLQRRGVYPPPPGASPLPGLEVAGTVVDKAADVGAPGIGDRVCALVAGGGYAAYCTAPAAQCLPIPDGMELETAAALPETFFTVWANVFDRARLGRGETLLVHGGTSGIGTTAIQLAKAFGARVATTAGSDRKCAACHDLGADLAVNYRTQDFVPAVLDLTDGAGADVILDMVGGDYVPRNLKALAEGGRHVSIAFLSGHKVTVDLSLVMRRRLVLTGSTLRPRPVAEKAAIADALRRQVWPMLADGRIRPVLDQRFALADAAAAHARMESSEHIGKILLTV